MSSSYSSLVKVSSLDGESLIFNFSHILFSYYESSFFFFLCVIFPESAERNHFLLAHIPHMNESHDPGRPFKVAITASAFFTHRFKLFFDLRDLYKVWSLHFGSSHSSTGFLRSYSDFCSSLEIAWSRNQTSLGYLRKILLVQVDS